MVTCYKNFLLLNLIASSNITRLKAENEIFKGLGAVALGTIGWFTVGWVGNTYTQWSDSNILSLAKNTIDNSEKYRRELSSVYLSSQENNCIALANQLLSAHYTSTGLPNIPSTIEVIADQISITCDNLHKSKATLQQKIVVWEKDLKDAEKRRDAQQYLTIIDMHINFMESLNRYFVSNKANLILYKQKEALFSKNHLFLTLLENHSFSCTFGQYAQAHVQKYSYAKDWVYLTLAKIVKEDSEILSQKLHAYNLNSSWQSYQEACRLRDSLNRLYSIIVGSREYQDQLTAKKVYELQKRQTEAAEKAARAAEQQALMAREQLHAMKEKNRIKQESLNMLNALLLELAIRKQNYELDYYPAAIQNLIDSINYEIARDCNKAEIDRLQRELNRALNERAIWF